MTFPHFNRRLHLYLGLALLPWFFMYGVSSIPFAHNQYFQARDAARNLPNSTVRLERALDLPIPEKDEELRAFGAALLRDAGVDGRSFGVYRPNASRLHVYAFTFWDATEVIYRADQRKLTVEDRRFRWDHFLTGMHARGGFEQDGFLQDSWSVVVDIVSVGMMVWIASGLYMWWGLRGHRGWGWLAILAGAASFAGFTLGL
ncbi:MAG: hypothetical protein KIT09_27130 [Bryobacteraceae bacterium]|nr:hypothetical protein [Bryobacteraceae bacterium]